VLEKKGSNNDQSLHSSLNRQGGDLAENFEFLTLPRQEKVAADTAGASVVISGAKSPADAARVEHYSKIMQEPKRVLEFPVQDRWLKLGWLKKLANNSYPMMPLGVDNISLKVNPQDIGSIIAFALTSNIYLEGLARA